MTMLKGTILTKLFELSILLIILIMIKIIIHESYIDDSGCPVTLVIFYF